MSASPLLPSLLQRPSHTPSRLVAFPTPSFPPPLRRRRRARPSPFEVRNPPSVMSTDPSVRQIRPQDAHSAQAAQMSSFQFVPHQFSQREPQKSQYISRWAVRLSSCSLQTCLSRHDNCPPLSIAGTRLTQWHPDYVFVDEHNRHKRLKGILLGQ